MRLMPCGGSLILSDVREARARYRLTTFMA
jgi:hypothetical protein